MRAVRAAALAALVVVVLCVFAGAFATALVFATVALALLAVTLT